MTCTSQFRDSYSKRAVYTVLMQLLAANAMAAGFQINPTASSVARSMGGNGIIGEDLGDMFFNPAGLALTTADKAFQFSGTFLKLENQFVDAGSVFNSGPAVPGNLAASNDTGTPIGIFGSLKSRSNPNLNFGLALTVPFGLSNSYERDWIGRYHATSSELKVFDLNLMASYQLNDELMLGFGISGQFAEATLVQAVPTPGGDVLVNTKGDDNGVGFNAGMVYQPNPVLKFGISYRSKVEHELSGKQTWTLGGTSIQELGAKAPLDLPDSLHLSLHYQPDNSRWSLALGARKTKWSRFSELRVDYENGSPSSVTAQNWEDSWTSGISVDYRLDNGDRLIASLGYDETPVPDSVHRGVLIPDADHKVVGFGYRAPGLFGLCQDCEGYFGYHKTIVGSREINNRNAINLMSGYFESHGTDVYSLHFQRNW